MRTNALWVARLGLIVAGGVLIVASAKATGTHHGGSQCSTETVKGRYLFAADGFDADAGEHMAVGGWETFDGQGNVRGFVTTTVGTMVSSDTFTGTYTVDKECSGTEAVSIGGNTVIFNQYYMPSGKKFTWIVTYPGFNLAGWDLRDDGDEGSHE